MCTILNPVFSILSLSAIALVMFLVPPAIAIFRSSFYRSPYGIYSETAPARYFFTAFMLLILGFGDIPWQLYRMIHYYQSGIETSATVVMRHYGRTLPYYDYQPPFPSEQQVVTADASLLRPERLGKKNITFNWIHKEGDVVSIRVLPSCPSIAWTQVQDISVAFGFLPAIVIVILWLVPDRYLLRKTNTQTVLPPSIQEGEKERWRRP